MDISFDIESIYHSTPERLAEYQGNEQLDFVLNALALFQLKAIFYCVSDFVQAHPRILKKIVKDGHEIGSHSKTHPNLSSLDRNAVKNELLVSREVLEQLSGTSVKAFRAPCFAHPENYVEFLNDLALAGYTMDSSYISSMLEKPTLSHEAIKLRPVVGVPFAGRIILPGGRYARFLPPPMIKALALKARACYFHLHDFDFRVTCTEPKVYGDNWLSRSTAMQARRSFLAILQTTTG